MSLLKSHLCSLFQNLQIIKQFDLHALPTELTDPMKQLYGQLVMYKPVGENYLLSEPLTTAPDLIPTAPPLPTHSTTLIESDISYTDSPNKTTHSTIRLRNRTPKSIQSSSRNSPIYRTPSRRLRHRVVWKNVVTKLPLDED